jgi:RHS repeat-associated protein
VGSATTLIAGQAITRGNGGAVNRIDTFASAAAFDAEAGAFSGNPSRVQTFGYDGNARLTQENSYKAEQLSAWLTDNNQPATQAATYAYDEVGNRASKTVVTPGGTESTSYAYDSNDRLLSETKLTNTGSSLTTTYTWDGNGNLASKQTPSEYTGYRFDADNRLVEVRRGASASSTATIASYAYDADGQRIGKTTPTGTTRYLIDPTTSWPQVVLESTTTSTGTERVAYVWGDSLRQQVKGAQGAVFAAQSESLIPLSGHLGTPIAAIDQLASVVETQEINAWGELQDAAPSLSHQFTGEYWDASIASTYLRARWYFNGDARFVSLDPRPSVAMRPKSSNRYSYAESDPTNAADPSGMTTLTENGVAFGGSMEVAQATLRALTLVSRSPMTKIGIRLLSSGFKLTSAQMEEIENCSRNPQDPDCQTDVPTLFFGMQHQQHAALIRETYDSKRPLGALHRSDMHVRNGVNRHWYANMTECKGLTGRILMMDCDEFPYFKQEEGGPANYNDGLVGLKPVFFRENRSAGSVWGHFTDRCRVLADDNGSSSHFIIPLPFEAQIPTFHVGRSCR